MADSPIPTTLGRFTARRITIRPPPWCAPVSTSPATIQPVTYAATAPETVVTETAAPAVEIPCGCACGCNGVRPCVCSYQCGEEYSFYGDDFDIETSFTSYAESLNPEQIWSSYARLDDLWGIE